MVWLPWREAIAAWAASLLASLTKAQPSDICLYFNLKPPPPSYCLKKNYLCWPHQGHAGWCIPRSTHMDLVPANIWYLTFDIRLTWTICPFMYGNQTVRHVIYWRSDFDFKTHRRSAGHRLPSREKNIQIGQKRNCALRDIFKGKLVVWIGSRMC